MRFLERAPGRPGTCAIFPQFGGQHPRGYVSLGTVLPGWDPEVVLSVQGLEEVVRFLGWPTVQDHANAVAELDRTRARVEELEVALDEADRFAESVKWTLGRFGEEVQKKPGRPKKKATETPEAA